MSDLVDSKNDETSASCRLCGARHIGQEIDFGLQPICNRFLVSPTEAESLFPLRIGQCGACGIVQAVELPSAAELRPRSDWITYSEPEGHLDNLADTLAALPGLTQDSAICGITFKDDTLLRRMRERGFARTWRLDPQRDLGVRETGVGVETIQDRLDLETAVELSRVHGKSDVVIARHIWEHAFDPASFVAALKELLTADGYLVLEVPDCERALTTCDYTTVWEEHTLYFTPVTFRLGIAHVGLSLHRYELVPYSLENSLIAVTQRSGAATPAILDAAAMEEEFRRGEAYCGGLMAQRKRLGGHLASFRRQRGKIAALGAGHLACTFINLLELKEHIAFLVDDNPKKRGLYMPGSRLPIFDSSALRDPAIRLCLLSVSPDKENVVIERNRAFTEAGGQFASMFPASQYALKI